VRQSTHATAAPVRVYPNLRAIRRYEVVAHRGAMLEAGRRRQRAFGRGTEFERLRDYLPDDDVRRVAWKATARRRQPVVVEYESERSQNLVVLLDCGRLMGTPIGQLRKLDYAVDAAVLLAYVATRLGDRVGLVAFADRVTYYAPPARGRGQFNTLLDTLYAVEAQPVESDPARALAFLSLRQSKRSLVTVFSDLAETLEAEAIVAQLSRLARHHLPICASLSDPDVVELAAAAPSDASGVFEKVVAARLVEERRSAMARLQRSGVLTLDVPADQLSGALVDRYLEIKRRTML